MTRDFPGWVSSHSATLRTITVFDSTISNPGPGCSSRGKRIRGFDLGYFRFQTSRTSTHEKVFMSHCGKLATPSATLRMIPALTSPFKLHEILEYSRDRISAGFAHYIEPWKRFIHTSRRGRSCTSQLVCIGTSCSVRKAPGLFG